MPTSFEPSDPAPIAHVSYTTAVPSPDAGPWYRRKPTPTVIAFGAAGALAFAILLGLLLSPPMSRAGREPTQQASAPIDTPQALVEQFTFPRATEAYRAPDPAQVEKAYAMSKQVFRTGGVSELARYGLQCFRSLEKAPGYGLMDFCLAFDLFAEAQHSRLTAGEQPSATSWFGSRGARHHNVAQSVMAVEGDAASRLLDLRRLAAETAQRAGDVMAASLVPPAAAPMAAGATVAASAPADQLTVQVEPALTQAPTPVTGTPPVAQPALRRAVAAPPAARRGAPTETVPERPLLEVVDPPTTPEPAAAVEPVAQPVAPER